MDLGYARVSTTKQDLDRQILALEAAGIPAERIYVDKKSGATTNRPGLQAPTVRPHPPTSSRSRPETADFPSGVCASGIERSADTVLR